MVQGDVGDKSYLLIKGSVSVFVDAKRETDHSCHPQGEEGKEYIDSFDFNYDRFKAMCDDPAAKLSALDIFEKCTAPPKHKKKSEDGRQSAQSHHSLESGAGDANLKEQHETSLNKLIILMTSLQHEANTVLEEHHREYLIHYIALAKFKLDRENKLNRTEVK